MLRRSSATHRLVSYVTDVEGDFHYFQRFVSLSRVLRWEAVTTTVETATQSSAGAASMLTSRWAPLTSAVFLNPPASQDAAMPLHSTASEGVAVADAAPATPCADTGKPADDVHHHVVDLTRYRLGFRDATSHFVFGGDAFDQGADLTFGQALLDFQQRYPSRVHLLLGNRDLNKMVLYPRIAQEVGGLAPDIAEDSSFALPPPPKGSWVGSAKPLRYRQYLAQQRQQTAAAADSAAAGMDDFSSLVADPVSFLQWALHYKLGAPNAFEHRRAELDALHSLAATRGETPNSDEEGERDTVKAVAQSFFQAAQPGGVYHEYLRVGSLSCVLDGVLFVHGGVNGDNAGCVPSLNATSYTEQLVSGQWWLPGIRPPRDNNHEDDDDDGAAVAPPHATALEWLAAVEKFKTAAFDEWESGTGRRGESLRAYAFPRTVAPHSIAVGTVMGIDGPQHVSLPVATFLLQSGIHTICGGHQPVGDTPAVVRQPGGFVVVDADNSYSGRGNRYCTKFNRRGAAVMELLFDHPDDNGVVMNAVGTETTTHAAPSLTVHGYRADGTSFAYELYNDERIGRCVGEGWWVRLPPQAGAASPPPPSPLPSSSPSSQPYSQTEETAMMRQRCRELYELRRTGDAFRHEEARWATAAEVDALLWKMAASGQPTVPGELAPRYTKEALAEVRVHRLKTKVSRSKE